MITILLFIVVALLILNIILVYTLLKKRNDNTLLDLKHTVEQFISYNKESNKDAKQEFVINRRESAENANTLRMEVGQKIDTFSKNFSEQLLHFQSVIESNNKENRIEQKDSLNDFSNKQRVHFSELRKYLYDQAENSMAKLEAIRNTLEQKLLHLQEGNEKKLDEMRKTVDEKLNNTLEKRLGESFKHVSDRLEAVHKGLGEMQSLAVNVGDLKKVMTNVKSRGVLGEYQLQNLLEDLLTNDQYERNVKTKQGSGSNVEFAIKMPNGNNWEKVLWLPIDAKFPKEDYEMLVNAYENNEVENIEYYRKAFVKAIKKNAQDIKEKYIDPPNTTEYGIMFLPFESLYGEVLRIPGLFEQIQKDFKIVITGPTTLSALLNSLQMGFRTLAIEKRTSEVWDLLGAVKTEFTKFGDILAKTKKKLVEATTVLDTTEVRSRAIQRKLKNVQELSLDKTQQLLDEDINIDFSTDEI